MKKDDQTQAKKETRLQVLFTSEEYERIRRVVFLKKMRMSGFAHDLVMEGVKKLEKELGDKTI